MTKNRAHKRAARQRAAVTGERYVVARRAGSEPARPPGGRLHDLTHRVPGVPAHVDGGLQAQTPRVRNSASRVRTHQHGEPRVLVAWQNWIARRLGISER